MKIRLTCSTRHLKIENDQAFNQQDYTVITTHNKEEVKALLSNADDWAIAGFILLNDFFDKPFFFCQKETQSVDESFFISEYDLERLVLFIMFLWLIKDNSCYTLEIIWEVDNKFISIRRRDTIFSNSQGQFSDTVFSLAECHQASTYLDKYLSICIKPIEILGTEVQISKPSDFNEIDYNSFNRIERAFTFAFQARATSFLPAKISFYVLTIECLFSGDDMGEIQHKIAQRLANYIGNTKENKKDIFDFVKLVYKIRSKYLHGQKLEKKHTKREQLVLISTKLDDLLRITLVKILDDTDIFLTESDQLKEWLDGNMFS